MLIWWGVRASHPGPTGYEPVALTNCATAPNKQELLYHKLLICQYQNLKKLKFMAHVDLKIGGTRL